MIQYTKKLKNPALNKTYGTYLRLSTQKHDGILPFEDIKGSRKFLVLRIRDPDFFPSRIPDPTNNDQPTV
jgi:hypothetical protein